MPDHNPATNYPLGMPATQGLVQPWQAPPHADPHESDFVDLAQLWRVVARYKWLLLSMATLGLLAALLLSFVRTPLYRATATVQVDKRAASVVKFGREISPEGDLDDRTAMSTQLELLKSRGLAERVVDELQLNRALSARPDVPATDPAGAASPSEGQAGATGAQAGWRKWLERIEGSWRKLREPAAESAQQLSREQIVSAFRSMVQIEQVGDSRIIRVAVENPQPQLAARIANAITHAFIALNLERRLEASTYAKRFLDEQLARTKVKLEESERRLNEYARDNRLLSLDEKTDVANQTFTEFSTALAKAEQERIKFESEYRAIQSAPDTSRQVLSSATIQAYKTQRMQLDTEYQQNLKIFKPDFPRMVQLRAQIQELDNRIAAEVSSILRSVANDLAAARRQEALIKQRVAETRREIVRGQDLRVDYNLLKREVDTNRELYDGLLQQVKEVTVAGGVETNNIQVVDKAAAPLFPFKPRLSLNAGLGLLGGLTLGLLLAFLLESLDDSIKSADEVERTLMLPLLGTIPNVRIKTSLPSLALLAHVDPRCDLAEAYRSTRTALQFSTPRGAPRQLVVTSTSKDEGKTTTALALAINFAQLGSKVVLMDADMRNPAIDKYLGRYLDGQNTYGLSSFLAGHESDQPLLQDSKIPGLSVITAGPIPANPVDLLVGPRFGELLDRLHDEGFEYIIIEAPPVLGLADAIVLGNQVGAVLYVAEAGRTRKGHIKNALRRLRMAGVMPCGVVLTKTRAQHGTNYAYENYYGYGAARASRERLTAAPVEPALNAG